MSSLEMPDREMVEDVAESIAILSETIDRLTVRRDLLTGYFRGSLMTDKRKKFNVGRAVVKVYDRSEIYCTCHRVPARGCANVLAGEPVTFTSVELEPSIYIRHAKDDV